MLFCFGLTNWKEKDCTHVDLSQLDDPLPFNKYIYIYMFPLTRPVKLEGTMFSNYFIMKE